MVLPASFLPPADVVVTDDDVLVLMDVPGLSHEDLEIELVGDLLAVRGMRAYPYSANGDGGRAWRHVERGFGRFERLLRVPQGLDPDAVEASLSDGVLTMRIPKPEHMKPHRIAIGNGHRELAGVGS